MHLIMGLELIAENLFHMTQLRQVASMSGLSRRERVCSRCRGEPRHVRQSVELSAARLTKALLV